MKLDAKLVLGSIAAIFSQGHRTAGRQTLKLPKPNKVYVTKTIMKNNFLQSLRDKEAQSMI